MCVVYFCAGSGSKLAISFYIFPFLSSRRCSCAAPAAIDWASRRVALPCNSDINVYVFFFLPSINCPFVRQQAARHAYAQFTMVAATESARALFARGGPVSYVSLGGFRAKRGDAVVYCTNIPQYRSVYIDIL